MFEYRGRLFCKRVDKERKREYIEIKQLSNRLIDAKRKGVFIMKKTYKLEELDCANCAAKMEVAIKKIDGVEDASVNFMRQTLTLQTQDDKMDDILAQVKKTIKKIEPDVCVLS